VKLYYANASSSSRRVSLTIAHLGLDLEHVPIDLMKDRPRLTALNPNSKIPVLEDGDLRLWESHAIMLYLCDRTPEQQLAPTELRLRADVLRWLFWTSAHLSPAAGGIAFERLWKKLVTGGGPDPAQIAYHERFLHQFLTVLDDRLASRTWIVGEALTLADFSVAATLMYAEKVELPIAGYRHVAALRARVRDLPAWKRTEPTW
jgi:glutathione S-transferase